MWSLELLIATAALSTALGVASPARADEYDPLHGLVDTAAQRLLTADPVAAFKWIKGGSIEDPARVTQVLDAVGKDAHERGIDAAFVRRAFEDQIHATEGVEYTRFGQWKFDPATAPSTAPDLAESRTAIDGYNRTMVAEMAAQRDVLAGPYCRQALGDARAVVVAERRLDPLYARALDSATASYCPAT
ncbi:chorismate mutase [Mycolicibacterium sediminis]|uniref:Chorismate mutase n=1 Tax=Mycolicibacterium sediminis TaxID=1286180 RepID=A0A7I7R0L5_9MYCO|nr:chorismate mutase [Mycolicibacterium sediminis]BBY31757.1 secreted chorismate mutase [Mycolicibacterium sediminis]